MPGTASSPGADPARGDGLQVVVPRRWDHPSYYPVRDCVRQFVLAGARPRPMGRRSPGGWLLARAGVRGPGARRRAAPIIVPLMGGQFGLLYAAARHGSPVPICWDVWEPQWAAWAERLRPLRPELVFVTAVDSAEYLAEVLPNTRVVHLPEATRVDRYRAARPLAQRRIGLLELGRRSQSWHDTVTPALSAAGVRHLYQAKATELVFPSEDEMLSGLGDSVVLACFPSNDTHPQRSGRVETMTHRYLEGLASRCLLVGRAPRELVTLLGFDPVIDVDWGDPAGQLLALLAERDRWQSHAERAYLRVVGAGDWSARVEQALGAVGDTFAESRR